MDLGRTWAELLERVGTIEQLASATPITLTEGSAAGVRALDVRTIEGLHTTVLLDRGMDLGQAWYRGTPLAWLSPTGVSHPAFAAGGDWLACFHGGLLVTAGTQNVGDACEVDGIRHPLHGALSTTPARNVRWEVSGDPPEVIVEGVMREARVLGVDVELRRRLRFAVGLPRVVVEDAITNLGDCPMPLLLLYHFNLGWPVVDERSQLFGWPGAVRPRQDDVAAAAALGEHDRFAPPAAGWASQVFEHRDAVPPASRTLGVMNPDYRPTGGLAVAVTYSPHELPRLWRWRMLGRRTYLMAIEPATCSLAGRAAVLREPDPVATLAPEATRRCTVAVSVGVGAGARGLAEFDQHPPWT